MSVRTLPSGNGSSETGRELVTLGAGVASTRHSRRRWPRGGERLLGAVLVIGAWQLASSTGLIDAQTLAGPATVLRSGWHLLQDGTLPSAIWVSLRRVIEGVAIGVPLATVLALIAGLSRIGEDTVDGRISKGSPAPRATRCCSSCPTTRPRRSSPFGTTGTPEISGSGTTGSPSTVWSAISSVSTG